MITKQILVFNNISMQTFASTFSQMIYVCSLWLLFQSLADDSPMRYHVYYHLVQIARNVDQVKAVYSGIDQLKQQFASFPPSNEQMQKLLRLLHEVLLSCKQG